jgi:hypothetical protein
MAALDIEFLGIGAATFRVPAVRANLIKIAVGEKVLLRSVALNFSLTCITG